MGEKKEVKTKKISIIPLILVVGLTAEAQQLAFPGAEGFGRYSAGGRGGTIYEVTNLNDSGLGSFRQAVEASGPRIVVFRVSGTIELQSKLNITNPYITIAGQTAPGDGICIKNYVMRIQTHDVIIRYIRCRLGNETQQATDSITLYQCQDVIIDHCSASWSIDETLSVTGSDTNNITVQWTMITESLNDSYHPKGPHGYGSIIAGWIGDKEGGITFHRNLYAHHNNRNPKFAGDKNGVGPGARIDFRNNVIYNWGNRCGYSSHPQYSRSNYVANYLKFGPSTRESEKKTAFKTGSDRTSMYVADNYMVGSPEANQDNWLMINISNGVTPLGEPFPVAPVTTDDAQTAYQRVLDDVGATLPKRDAVDARIIAEVINGTGQIIDSQSEVDDWPALNSATAPTDSDNDGIPDDWELARGLEPYDASDGPEDRNGDGYTNVEEYLNWLCSATAKADLDNDFDIDLEDFAIFAEHWLEAECGLCSGADLAGRDGQVGLDDLREFVKHWLTGTE